MILRRGSLLVCVVLATFLLTGCWDKVELEDRGFVVSIGLDKSTGEGDELFSVSMAIPDVAALQEPQALKVSKGETLSGAMRRIDSYSSEKIYFGHTKASVVSEELLSDEDLFKEALDALERNREISRNIIILGTRGKSEDILSAKTQGEPTVGMFIDSFYRNNRGMSAAAFHQDLGGFIRELRENGHAVLPEIELLEEELYIGGAGVIKDFKLAGWLDEAETRGYLWACDKSVGSQVTARYRGVNVPFRIDSMNNRISFTEDGGILTATFIIHMRGIIEEFIFNDTTLLDERNIVELKSVLENAASDEVLAAADCLHNKFEVDGFSLKSHLRKQDYNLYLKYGEELSQNPGNIRIIPEVSVDITILRRDNSL